MWTFLEQRETYLRELNISAGLLLTLFLPRKILCILGSMPREMLCSLISKLGLRPTETACKTKRQNVKLTNTTAMMPRALMLLLSVTGLKTVVTNTMKKAAMKTKRANLTLTPEHIIIILTLGCGLLAGMCFAMCFNCIKKLVRDGRQIHENIRRSREQLEEQRSVSLGSSPKMAHRGRITTEDEEAYIEGKRNGHTCIHPDEEDTEEEDEEDEEEEEEEESCVEMRDCECQTRDSLLAQRDSGLHGTPPPPPPPTRRPPGLPPLSPPLAVPTPPPPPVTHSPYYNRHHHANDPYVSTYHHHHHHSASSQQTSDNYDGDELGGGEPYKHKHRTEALIQMKDRPKYEVTKAGKTTPDVLVTH
ncbi:hypothetical protein Anas_10719 [Armadillidium nasatum]|uniref:Uncharacterized protein n=1 Tax=Armadillidium nasatum TaxID=96803 RepID=A0A5N5T253_9CRUS|nr:hypothetical protein Anas_10719 [Armadillidium nasatum]